MTRPLILIPLLVFAACTKSGADYDPIVDGPKDARYYSDLSACRVLARQVESSTPGQRAAGGAIAGGVIGALTTDKSSDTLEDAAGGAVIGAIFSSATGDPDVDAKQQNVIMRCMAGRGYKVVG